MKLLSYSSADAIVAAVCRQFSITVPAWEAIKEIAEFDFGTGATFEGHWIEFYRGVVTIKVAGGHVSTSVVIDPAGMDSRDAFPTGRLLKVNEALASFIVYRFEDESSDDTNRVARSVGQEIWSSMAELRDLLVSALQYRGFPKARRGFALQQIEEITLFLDAPRRGVEAVFARRLRPTISLSDDIDVVATWFFEHQMATSGGHGVEYRSRFPMRAALLEWRASAVVLLHEIHGG